MISCGIWPSSRRLIAVIVSDAGRCRAPISIALSDEAAHALIEYLTTEIDADIVLTDRFLAKPIGQAAAAGRGRLWIAPTSLVESIRSAAALNARATAAMLARLPRVPTMRPLLRRRLTDPKQLTLL